MTSKEFFIWATPLIKICERENVPYSFSLESINRHTRLELYPEETRKEGQLVTYADWEKKTRDSIDAHLRGL